MALNPGWDLDDGLLADDGIDARAPREAESLEQVAQRLRAERALRSAIFGTQHFGEHDWSIMLTLFANGRMPLGMLARACAVDLSITRRWVAALRGGGWVMTDGALESPCLVMLSPTGRAAMADFLSAIR